MNEETKVHQLKLLEKRYEELTARFARLQTKVDGLCERMAELERRLNEYEEHDQFDPSEFDFDPEFTPALEPLNEGELSGVLDNLTDMDESRYQTPAHVSFTIDLSKYQN